MNIESLRLGELLDQTSAKTPVPGGGAVVGAVGALAAALAGMVVSYSLGRKSLAAHQSALDRAAITLGNARAVLLRLAEEDAAAYAVVNELTRLPEGDERRARELPGAAEAATRIPLAVIATCADLLALMERLAGTTNPHLRSDLAIAAVLGEATARGSWWNVSINMPLWREAGLRGDPLKEAGEMLERCGASLAAVDRACRG